MVDILVFTNSGAWLTTHETADACGTSAQVFAAGLLKRLRRRIRKNGKDLASLDDETRRETRKTAKKLRYAAEFLAALWPEDKARRRHAKFVSALSKLQDRLGDLKDLATRPVLIESLGLSGLTIDNLALPSKSKSAFLKEAQEALDDLADAKRFWE